MPSLSLAEFQPMLPREQKTIPKGSGWHFEWKFDGYRMIAGTSPPALRTKNGADATRWFPELIPGLEALPPGTVLDGEITVLDDMGRSDFDRMHARAMRRRWYEGADLVAYCAFDLLAYRGKDMRGQPLEARKRRLRQLLPPASRELRFLFVDSVEDGEWLYQAALALELEGIVAKRAGSLYVAGYSWQWVKIKRPGAVRPGRFKRSVS